MSWSRMWIQQQSFCFPPLLKDPSQINGSDCPNNHEKEEVENYMSVSLRNYFNQMMNYSESTWKIKKGKEAVGICKEQIVLQKI